MKKAVFLLLILGSVSYLAAAKPAPVAPSPEAIGDLAGELPHLKSPGQVPEKSAGQMPKKSGEQPSVKDPGQAEAVPVPKDLIRFHVLANSDSAADQALKRRVRDAVVSKMAPVFRQAESVTEAKKTAIKNLRQIEEIAAGEIKAAGKSYPVHAYFGTYDFPTKTYGKLSLPAGRYQAVRVIIGKGRGANWWCVLFPPLCFVDLTHGLAANPGLLFDNPQGKIEVRFKTLEVLSSLEGRFKQFLEAI